MLTTLPHHKLNTNSMYSLSQMPKEMEVVLNLVLCKPKY